MVEKASENINTHLSTDLDELSIESSSESSCQLRVTPYPMYVANILFTITYAISRVIRDSIIYNKLCYIKYDNLTLCINSTFTTHHPALQQDAVTWGNYESLAELPLALLTTLMLCSYCDRVGHKLPYFLPVCGNFLATVYLAVLSTPSLIGWPMESIFGYSVLYTCLGNFSLAIMTSFSYVALITPKEKVSVSMAICEGTLLFGFVVGTFINGPIIDATSLSTMAYINAGLTLLPLVVIAIFLRNATERTGRKYTWRDAISFNHILDAFKCIFRRRKGFDRFLLNLSFFMFSCVFLTLEGFLAGSFLYFVKENGMSMTEYSVFSGLLSALKSVVGPAILLLLNRFLNPRRTSILLAAGTSMAAGYLIMSITSIPYSNWVGAIFLCAQTVFFGECRSLQTSFCEKDEFGKLFAYDALIETLLSTAGRVAFRSLYSASLSFWPGMFLGVCSGLMFLAMIITLSIDKLQRSVSTGSTLYLTF